ncbi:DUF6185 family protein [Streptomyces sp. NPDC058000]|uniref:DUF6185 family protein n=1 Tax=Streptomyces sp. NPDC058000 TaxID=3346299 RepID=UPI0036ECF4B5
MSASEMTSVAWRWIVLACLTLGCWAAQPAQAYAADAVHCPATQLTKANVLKSTLTLSQRHQDFVEVRQELIIEVPEWQWRLAGDLTLSADSPRYRNAMYCLLHAESETREGFEKWHPEWKSSSSRSTKDKGLVTVHYGSWNLIGDEPGEYEVGPWTVSVESGKWVAGLYSQGALRESSWQEVEVDPGALGISEAPRATRTSKDSSRVWYAYSPKGIEVQLMPLRATSLEPIRQAWIKYLGITSWWVCASVVIFVSAGKFLNRIKNAGNSEETASKTLAIMVLGWAGVSAVLGLAFVLVLRPSPDVTQWRALIGVVSGPILVLCVWLSVVQSSNGSHPRLKKICVVMVVTVFLVAGVGLLVIFGHRLFGLPKNLIPKAPLSGVGIAGLILLDLSILWLWLIAMVAWGWRFAREVKVSEPSSGTEPGQDESSIEREPEHPLRHIVAIGAALAVVAGMVVACRVLSAELRWKRANWMAEATVLFRTDRGSDLGYQLADFASRGPEWAYAYTWVLSGIALVALLHRSSRTEPEKPLGPKGADLLLVSAIFAIVVALRGTLFAGSVAAVYGLWVPMNMAALYAMVKAGRRWSVLSRVDRKTGKQCVVAELSDPAKYGKLLDDAHRCRDLLHRLRLVDHGRAKERTRQSLEKQLRLLHHWRPNHWRPIGSDKDCLPDPVSVVDVALSWGPCRNWWGNGVNAARWAAIFGILPSMVAAWYKQAFGAKHWTFTLNSPTGVPDTVGFFLMQEISFAGAGLVLGALWRLLPGERGPVRAFNLFIAWLVPIGVVAALNVSIGHKDLGLAVLDVILMLMVLTLASMWMDTDTFSRERPYATRRLGLVTSIYQAHGLSGVIAFLIAQVATAVTIWHQIVTPPK